MPVTALYCEFLLLLAQTHTGLQTVVDTRCISYDEGWSVVSLSFLDGIEILSWRCAHCNLCNVNIAIAHCHHTEVLLAYLLA